MKKALIIAIFALLLTACAQSTHEEKTVVRDGEWIQAENNGESPSFRGNINLKGWIVNVPFYVGDEEPHFRVAAEDVSKLPKHFQDRSDFIIKEIDEEGYVERIDEVLIEHLLDYSEFNPAELNVMVIEGNHVGEGSAHIIIDVGASDAFRRSPLSSTWTAVNHYPDVYPEEKWESADYEGRVQISGWIEDKNIRGDESIVFQVAPEDIKNLPKAMQGHKSHYYYIGVGLFPDQNISEDQMAKLRTYSSSEPGQVMVKRIGFRMEGPGYMQIAPF